MSAYESIAKGLKEAFAFAHRKADGSRVHKVEVTQVDVSPIRASTGVSHGTVARSLRVKTRIGQRDRN